MEPIGSFFNHLIQNPNEAAEMGEKLLATVVANCKVYEYCFMKQKSQIQMGIVKCKNAATPLSTSGINTTHQHFQMRYIALFYLKELKSYQPKYKCKVYFTKEIYTFKL